MRIGHLTASELQCSVHGRRKLARTACNHDCKKYQLTQEAPIRSEGGIGLRSTNTRTHTHQDTHRTRCDENSSTVNKFEQGERERKTKKGRNADIQREKKGSRFLTLFGLPMLRPTFPYAEHISKRLLKIAFPSAPCPAHKDSMSK